MLWSLDLEQSPDDYEVAVEIPPPLLFKELVQQPKTYTVRSPESRFEVDPPAETASLREARNRARIVSAHTGMVLESQQDTIFGGFGTDETKTLVSLQWKNIEEGIFKERYGPRSFFARWAEGILETGEYQYYLTWLTVQARFYELPPEGIQETEQEQQLRTAKAKKYREACSELHDRWLYAYDEALRAENEIFNAATGVAKVRSERRINFFQQKKNEAPQSLFDQTKWLDRREIKKLLDSRDKLFSYRWSDGWKDYRVARFREAASLDVLASVLQNSRHVVDIRHLLKQPVYRKIWCDRISWMAEQIPKFTFKRYKRYWFTCYTKDYIKASLHCVKLSNEGEHGTWEDIPIIMRRMKAVKRRHHEIHS